MQNRNGITFNAELARKSIHISNLVIPFSIYLFSPSKVIPFLLFFMVFCISMDSLRINSTYFKNIYNHFFGFMTRNKENVVFTGATNVLIGATIVTIFFNKSAIIPSLVVMSISDTLAAIVGIKYGSITTVNQKTLEGTFSFSSSCFIILFLFELGFATSLIISIITTMSELFISNKYIDDNLFIPIIVATLITLLV